MVNLHPLREALRLRRVQLRLTLKALGRKTGLNVASIHSIENVKREPNLKPKIETLNTLAEAMDMDLALTLVPRGASLESGRAELDTGGKTSEAHARMTGSDTRPRDKDSSNSMAGGAHGGDRSVQGQLSKAVAIDLAQALFEYAGVQPQSKPTGHVGRPHLQARSAGGKKARGR